MLIELPGVPSPGANVPPLAIVVAPTIEPRPARVPLFVKPPRPVLMTDPASKLLIVPPVLVMPPALAVRVPEFWMNAPALLLAVIALSVRPAAIATPFASVELLVSVPRPVRLPPETASLAVLLLVIDDDGS